MNRVRVNLKKIVDNSYDILIDKNLLKKLPSELKQNPLGNKYAIITDSNVEKLFGKDILRSMKRHKIDAVLLSFKAGEQSKRLSVFERLITKVHKAKLDRKSAIIALGGGVVGDMAGFIASTYMRGINYIQVPTTLLAMVDSSIGGKVAVDLTTGKNMVGNFCQPKKVFIDITLLKSLPKDEIINGLSEVIKHALIQDSTLFDFLEKNLDQIMARNPNVLLKLIKRNCEIKANIVEEDEKEQGLRKIVNYGHTIGHALETLTNFKMFSHGQAIAIGMSVAGTISNKIGMLTKKELDVQNRLLKRIGFKTKVPNIPTARIVAELKKDKKIIGGRIELVLLSSIGNAKYGINVPNGTITDSIEKCKR